MAEAVHQCVDPNAIIGRSDTPGSAMRLADWWLTSPLYYVLPNRLYWLLGANICGSTGEHCWHNLLEALDLQVPHWSQERNSGDPSEDSDATDV